MMRQYRRMCHNRARFSGSKTDYLMLCSTHILYRRAETVCRRAGHSDLAGPTLEAHNAMESYGSNFRRKAELVAAVGGGSFETCPVQLQLCVMCFYSDPPVSYRLVNTAETRRESE